jgi:hypothetical protein
MLVLLLIIQFGIWIALACFRGSFEALLWHCNTVANDELKKDYHPEFTMERTLLYFAVWLPIAVFCFLKHYYLGPLYFGLAMFFCYPFFHNGSKYCRRNDLNARIYKLRWMAEPSKTSIAKMNLSWVQRRIAFSIGLGFFIISIIRAW